MSPAAPNLNLRRRPLPGLLAVLAAIPLRLLLAPLRRKKAPEALPWVFASYMVGDLFMALPALKRAASALGPRSLRVVCRPDCAELLRREGFDVVPFDNAFFVRKSLRAFARTARAAWRLRSLPVSEVLDLDADPRTALWMRVAGAPRVVSFRRPFGVLFDATFELPASAIHQAEKDAAALDAFLTARGTRADFHGSSPIPVESTAKNSPWLLSVWTRKAKKNWPLERWEQFLERLEARGVPFAVLDAPDGDFAFQAFRARWRGRADFVSGSLAQVLERVREAAGVVATDNFLGHMAGYCGKPVLWINVCSPAAQVQPRGPRTLRVGPAGEAPSSALPSVDEAWSRFLELTD
jgi:ADP-heptose:LPS heptosyltransferase